MNEENLIPENIDDKLFSVKYTCDSESHLIVKQEKCFKCKEKFCTYVCPANVYCWDTTEQKLQVRYENCLECGACKIACEKNNIDWRYPRAGYGVRFKQG